MTNQQSNGIITENCIHCQTLQKELQKMKERNERLTVALVSVCEEQIKSATSGIRYIKERREMSETELVEYYQKKKKTWEQRKKSYLF